MSVYGAMDISASGMTAQQLRTDIISQNIANVNTTRDGNGKVYKRKTVVFEEKVILHLMNPCSMQPEISVRVSK